MVHCTRVGGGCYTIITGDLGTGKSTAVENAVHNVSGVMICKVFDQTTNLQLFQDLARSCGFDDNLNIGIQDFIDALINAKSHVGSVPPTIVFQVAYAASFETVDRVRYLAKVFVSSGRRLYGWKR